RRAEAPDEPMELEVELPPRGLAPPKHVHRFHAERFEVVSGELQLFTGGRWRTLRAGEVIDVPAGELHSFRNRSRERTVARAQATPGGCFQAWFDDYWQHVEVAFQDE